MHRLLGRILLVAVAFTCPLPAAAAMPDYVRQALAGFDPQVPPGWAYTLTTVRNRETRATTRFDPSRPPADQWTLLELNGRPPTESEIAQFARSRAGAAPQASFRKADIDPASVELISEDADRAQIRCAFREVATGSDKMLGHLALRLTINKHRPHVETSLLELTEPYSPVLGVKMRSLVVKANFAPPTDERPSLPVDHSSHFIGRIFFIGTEETLVLKYSDFVAKP